MKKLAVAYVRVDALTPYAKNARTHSEAQISQLVASIRKFGWTNPILVDGSKGIIAGHGRLMAAKALGMTEVPVIELSGLTAAEKRAYILADNKLALNAGWDETLLAEELRALGDIGLNLDDIGFSADELTTLLADKTAGLTDPDDVPDAPVDPVSQKGDLWILGNHRLLCGDSTDAAAVERLLNGVKPHLMVTDPPYGVEYDPTWRDALKRGEKFAAKGKVQNDDQADWTSAWSLFPGDVAYVWHGALHSATVADNLNAAGFNIRSQIIWAKQHFAIGRGDYHWQHEPCWYAVRGKGHWAGDRSQTTLWKINTGVGYATQKAGTDARTGHGTQKPVECMRRPIVNNSSPGQAIYEPFCGSGTTMIAAEMEGRHAYCMELSEAYVDVICRRWQTFTGLAARLDGDMRTFDEIAAERALKAA